MNTEEKAKAYDEALSKAREYHFQGQAPDKLAELEAIFPELRESEDERIRKWLVAQMQKFHDAANKEGCWEDFDMTEKAISYLEKQKEQKSVTIVRIPKFRVGDIIQRVPLEKWDSSKKITSIDEHGYNFNLSHLGDTVSGGAIGFAFEDEYELVEQKPAEWSEEDEEALREVKLNFELNHDNMTPTLVGFYERFFNKLKSLRPKHHWKPTNEQMNHLSAAVIEAQRRHNESVNGFPRYRVLKELYEQLQKLM